MNHGNIPLTVAILVLATCRTPAAEFIPLGFPITTNIHPSMVSVAEDGSVVAGACFCLPNDHLYRWTRDSGTEILPFSLEASFGTASISGDGSVIASTQTPSKAVKITDAGIELLPVPPGVSQSQARLISQDGSTVFGLIDDAFARWTDGGYELLANTGYPKGTSANGDVMVFDRSRWSEQDGVQSLPVEGSPERVGVFGLSSNGRWSVGRTGTGGASQNWAVRWDGLSLPERLLPASQDWGATALDITPDGSSGGWQALSDGRLSGLRGRHLDGGSGHGIASGSACQSTRAGRRARRVATDRCLRRHGQRTFPSGARHQPRRERRGIPCRPRSRGLNADFDSDGDVDGDDFLIWQASYVTDAGGDADGDGDTDGDDFLLWQAAYESGSGSGRRDSCHGAGTGGMLMIAAGVLVGLVPRKSRGSAGRPPARRTHI